MEEDFSLALGSGLDSFFLSPLLQLNIGNSLAASFFVLFFVFPHLMDPREFSPASVSPNQEGGSMLLRIVWKAGYLL